MQFVRWKEEKYFHFNTNFSKEGQIIRKNEQSITHPVIVFMTNTDVYFLNARSAKNTRYEWRRKQGSEFLIEFNNKKPSYVDMSSIQIMNRNDFFKIYVKDKVLNLNNCVSEQQEREFYFEFRNYILHNKKLTIQYVNLKNKNTSNKVIFSNIDSVNVEWNLKNKNKILGLAQREYIKNTCLCISISPYNSLTILKSF
ncbi:Mbov_0400 family ICE element protein [Mycoplasmopsis hyopharyngis]|uniref:Mbov_0400 family ICE element protein n=1 Tax=Mycoplasmopsis hyopharyngis TaxID=29558 RepID=UPI00387350BF